jgi:hypothetical protein
MSAVRVLSVSSYLHSMIGRSSRVAAFLTEFAFLHITSHNTAKLVKMNACDEREAKGGKFLSFEVFFNRVIDRYIPRS